MTITESEREMTGERYELPCGCFAEFLGFTEFEERPQYLIDMCKECTSERQSDFLVFKLRMQLEGLEELN